jgi:hypothetical protein
MYCPFINLWDLPVEIKKPSDAVHTSKNGNHTFIAVSSKYEKIHCYKPLTGLLPDFLKTIRDKKFLKERCPDFPNLHQAQTYLPFLRQTNTNDLTSLLKWKANCIAHFVAGKKLSSSHLKLDKLRNFIKLVAKEEKFNHEYRKCQRKSFRVEMSFELRSEEDWRKSLVRPFFDTIYMIKDKVKFFNIQPYLDISYLCFEALLKRMECIIMHLNQHVNLPNSTLSLTLLEDAIQRVDNYYSGKFLMG